MAWTEITRRHYQRDHLRYASDTTEEEWGVVAPHLPPPANCGRCRRCGVVSACDRARSKDRKPAFYRLVRALGGHSAAGAPRPSLGNINRDLNLVRSRRPRRALHRPCNCCHRSKKYHYLGNFVEEARRSVKPGVSIEPALTVSTRIWRSLRCAREGTYRGFGGTIDAVGRQPFAADEEARSERWKRRPASREPLSGP
jgi:hypothetical protein